MPVPPARERRVRCVDFARPEGGLSTGPPVPLRGAAAPRRRSPNTSRGEPEARPAWRQLPGRRPGPAHQALACSSDRKKLRVRQSVVTRLARADRRAHPPTPSPHASRPGLGPTRSVRASPQWWQDARMVAASGHRGQSQRVDGAAGVAAAPAVLAGPLCEGGGRRGERVGEAHPALRHQDEIGGVEPRHCRRDGAGCQPTVGCHLGRSRPDLPAGEEPPDHRAMDGAGLFIERLATPPTWPRTRRRRVCQPAGAASPCSRSGRSPVEARRGAKPWNSHSS